jgi:hypothetical protein
MPFNAISDPSEPQLRWQIATSLAYGARGVIYFCYWTPYLPVTRPDPVGDWNGAIVRSDGTPTRHYQHARTINAALANYGRVQMKLIPHPIGVSTWSADRSKSSFETYC